MSHVSLVIIAFEKERTETKVASLIFMKFSKDIPKYTCVKEFLKNRK